MKKPFVTLEEVNKIKETYPTPFHLYDEKGIRENARRLKEAFSWTRGLKSILRLRLRQPVLLNIFKEEGCGADCSSYTELLLL